jgi:chromosome segregation ATPase
LLAQSENESNKYEFAQLELHRDIQLLEDEMNNLMSDKETECQNYDQLLLDLNFRLKEKETENEDLRSEIAEYEAIVNGLKTDFEANNDLNDKKVGSLKQASSELQERIEYLNLNVACLEDKNHELEEKTIEQEAEIIASREMLIKNERALLDLKESEGKLAVSAEALRRELKGLQERYVELEMLCNSEREGREKAVAMLEEEEKKCQKLNDFVNGLISQKEAAIKSELEKSEENNQLENQIFELTHQRDLLQEEGQTGRRKLEESKEECKALVKSVKALEKQAAEERAKVARLGEKVKEREGDLEIKKEYIKDLEEKYRELREKNYKEIRELSNELEDKSLIAINASRDLNDKIIKVETESKKRWEEALSLQEELEHLTKQLYAERDRVEDLTIELGRVKEEKMAAEEEVVSREFALQ